MSIRTFTLIAFAFLAVLHLAVSFASENDGAIDGIGLDQVDKGETVVRAKRNNYFEGDQGSIGYSNYYDSGIDDDDDGGDDDDDDDDDDDSSDSDSDSDSDEDEDEEEDYYY